MATKRIFVSFDYDNDRHYKNLLLAWDKNKEFDFEFYDGSLRDAIDSKNAAYIKSKIRPLIDKSSHLLCIVGKECSDSAWIEWEVQTAVDLNKKLIAVKIEKSYSSPAVLLKNGAKWALSFNFPAIKSAVESA
jgi:hypothetical protein